MGLASLRNAPGMIAYAPEQLSSGAKKGFLNSFITFEQLS